MRATITSATGVMWESHDSKKGRGKLVDDLYDSPAKFDLTIIGSADKDELWSYGFDMFVVWQHLNGRVYWAADSGCSCPSPFRYYSSLDKATCGTTQECDQALLEWATDDENGEDHTCDASVTQLRDKIAALR